MVFKVFFKKTTPRFSHFRCLLNPKHIIKTLVYLAVDTRTQKEVAIKVETTNITPQSLPYEYKVYKRLKGGEGIPKIHFFGIDRGRQISILAMELLGPSLEDLFKFCGQKLSTKTTLMLADQMLSKVEWIHERNLVHRDIKPDNFMMGIGKNCNRVYIADFGLAKVSSIKMSNRKCNLIS